MFAVVNVHSYACICFRVHPQVCLKDTNKIEMDSDVSVEIPSDTVIAYSILELEIKKNGDYGEFKGV